MNQSESLDFVLPVGREGAGPKKAEALPGACAYPELAPARNSRKIAAHLPIDLFDRGTPVCRKLVFPFLLIFSRARNKAIQAPFLPHPH